MVQRRDRTSSYFIATKPKPRDSPFTGLRTMRASLHVPYLPNLVSTSCAAQSSKHGGAWHEPAVPLLFKHNRRLLQLYTANHSPLKALLTRGSLHQFPSAASCT